MSSKFQAFFIKLFIILNWGGEDSLCKRHSPLGKSCWKWQNCGKPMEFYSWETVQTLFVMYVAQWEWNKLDLRNCIYSEVPVWKYCFWKRQLCFIGKDKLFLPHKLTKFKWWRSRWFSETGNSVSCYAYVFLSVYRIVWGTWGTLDHWTYHLNKP